MIKIFTQPNCAPCVQVKKYLEKKNVEFKEIDRDGNEQEMMQIAGVISTPVVVSPKGVAIGANFGQLAQII